MSDTNAAFITLEVTDGGAARVQGRELPLAGMEVEGDRPGQRVVFHLGGEPTGHRLTHELARPAHVRLDQTVAGALRGLEVDSDEGQTVRLRFRSPMLPEMVDGI